MSATSIGMHTVFELGLELPDVEAGTYYGAQALKVNGRMMACAPVNKSAETNSAIVAMSFERRAILLRKSPLLYYITDHYAKHETLLVRLSKVSRAELKQTLGMAREFASAASVVRRAGGRAKQR